MKKLSIYANCPAGNLGVAFFIFIFWVVLLPANKLPAKEFDLMELSIEELMDIKVTSVSKKTQKRSDSAAAIYVITNEDIKRSGVTNIPDALRMAPGVNVSRIDSNKWAVSVRGFNSRFAANILVLIDGRSIYTPSFSGVYWEVNDVLLEDVDRIEVIRGPGATLWGANAMNGVINIITKDSSETQGGFLSAGGGNFEKYMLSGRYGDSFGEDTSWRVYAKSFKRDSLQFKTNEDAGDDWNMLQAGFKMDSTLSPADKVTLQGGMYEGDLNQKLNLVTQTAPYMKVTPGEVDVSGANVLSRWTHTISSTSNFSFQVYFDTSERKKDFVNEDRDNIDVEFQHLFSMGTRHNIVWGGRFRHTSDDYINTSTANISPLSKSDDLYSAFLQDEISFLDDKIKFTMGSKFEHNDYSGYEIQPSARLMWAIDSKNKIWGSVSKAVRTPSRVESGSELANIAYDSGVPGVPAVVYIVGTENFQSEELIAYELGYRFLPNQNLSVDTALFYNDYDMLRGGETQTPYFTGTQFRQDIILDNSINGETYGGEIVLKYKASNYANYELSYSLLIPDFGDQESAGFPKHQAALRGQYNLIDDIDLDIWLRYVDDMVATDIRSATGFTPIEDYITMDIRFGWRITPSIELAVVGQNLLCPNRVEFIQESFTLPVEVDRSFYTTLSYRF